MTITSTTTPAPPATTAPVRLAAAPTTTTTAVPSTTAVKRTTTTTTKPVPIVTVPPALSPKATTGTSGTGVPSHGKATWFRAPHGTCAHMTLPMGTMVTVTRRSTGATTTCKVNDRGPTTEGVIIDLSKDRFLELAPLPVGVIDVSISW